ncbi:hypothetical protein DEO72_LG11g1556 [Vigna unguiculata]|uniref:Uncharacterized protein n=1 Tax=Vigna unguiculata TaxID=3917 RepID=A0A4D6NL74_VIGUN|nr:hypothetical protein DEO72_LG11g1556 [Vigna unguiculata]
MPRFSFNRGYRDSDIFSDFSTSFTISGQPSSSPTISATVPHNSHRPAHLRRTAPTIPHTFDAPGQHFVACTAPHRPFLMTSATLRHRPTPLPPSLTPLTHSSHHPAHLRRSRPSFRRLHRTAATSSSSSTNHHHHCTAEELCTPPKPLRVLRATITNVLCDSV